MRAGFGTDPSDIGQRLTWRQIRLFHDIEQERHVDHLADMIEAMAVGSRSKNIDRVLRRMRGNKH